MPVDTDYLEREVLRLKYRVDALEEKPYTKETCRTCVKPFRRGEEIDCSSGDCFNNDSPACHRWEGEKCQ